MKIAVSSSGQDLNSLVDPRFGRSPYFLVVDPETMEFETLSNPNLSAMHGAGIQTAQMIAGKGVTIVLTGNCGPNAFQTLSAVGIKVIVGVTGKVKDALERYKKGELKPSSQASVPGHFGIGGVGPAAGTTPGMGTFPGGGRGMGGDRGAGSSMGRGMMGGGFQRAPYGETSFSRPAPVGKEEELKFLKAQAQAVSKELNKINERIKELEEKKK